MMPMTVPMRPRRGETDPMTAIAEEIMIAWADFEDSHSTEGFASLYTEAPASTPDHEIGTDGTPIDLALAIQIHKLLLIQKARPPFHWFVDPIQWAEGLQDSSMREALKVNGQLPGPFNSTMPPNAEYYIGSPIKGLHMWVVPGGMIESSGLHSIAVGTGAIGMAYENISTPLSPMASRVNIDIDWVPGARAWDVDFTVSQISGGLRNTSTTNKWMVDAIS